MPGKKSPGYGSCWVVRRWVLRLNHCRIIAHYEYLKKLTINEELKCSLLATDSAIAVANTDRRAMPLFNLIEKIQS
ncbi:hypothetical protein BCR33DRAFT_362844 [Rhizoclosmatium globosum]|uniref:Uncharacterized protein n=1 Tax=Rhizoclosmatium globosum TaxID=329046 RepID=A0A1Y2C007_9FUNG|nr:hypothetical protein BCR33DRAFT_362844 [Rhizoclosmatium globosum]|eukprot:ORY40358.1 hypothetical protein BCR33DRAFT_362844 [Rhizoclosmatium globosum]